LPDVKKYRDADVFRAGTVLKSEYMFAGGFAARGWVICSTTRRPNSMTASRIVPILLVSILAIGGCASDGPPVADTSAGVSGRKHYGQEHEISLRQILGRDRDRAQTSVTQPVVGDPEYQEYLEWKRWQEFKEYQKWKKENPEAAAPAAGES
jgi:hypothetical protein